MPFKSISQTRYEQCENCFSHVESPGCTKAAKNCNHRHVPELLTCAKCKEVRYCSRQCQRAQWKEHKDPCDAHIMILRALDIYGSRVKYVFKAFAKYSKGIAGQLETPALSALRLHLDKNRVNTHVFFVKVKAKETILKETSKYTRGVISFKLVSAECVTMDEMHDFMDYRAGPFSGPEQTERTMAHRPGLLRIFVLDISGLLPVPLDGYTLPTDISNWPPRYHLRYDPNWKERLFELFGQPLDGKQYNSDEEDDVDDDDQLDEDTVGHFLYPTDTQTSGIDGQDGVVESKKTARKEKDAFIAELIAALKET